MQASDLSNIPITLDLLTEDITKEDMSRGFQVVVYDPSELIQEIEASQHIKVKPSQNPEDCILGCYVVIFSLCRPRQSDIFHHHGQYEYKLIGVRNQDFSPIDRNVVDQMEEIIKSSYNAVNITRHTFIVPRMFEV